METYPLEAISISEAKGLQFKLVELMQQYFTGEELLQAGDYGVVPGLNQPRFTRKAEQVLADFFDAEAAMLVRGAGTGAIRNFFNANLNPNDRVLIHDAPLYPTTRVTFESMGLEVTKIDFNKLEEVKLPAKDFEVILIQNTRQKIDDSYNLEEVISKLQAAYPNSIIITDDNYAVMKVNKIGVQLGAEISTFSLFKLLGPEGIGCIVGKEQLIEEVRAINYSGGSQVQGPEAMEALKSLVYAPVSLAVQAEATKEIVSRLDQGAIEIVEESFIANAQSRVILVKFKDPIAKEFLDQVNKQGGVPYPVGAESRYEVGAMFYRISGTFREKYPDLEEYMIRINPMQAGADTVIRILKETLNQI